MKLKIACTIFMRLAVVSLLVSSGPVVAEPMHRNTVELTIALLRASPGLLPILHHVLRRTTSVPTADFEPDFARARAFFENGIRVGNPGLPEQGPEGVQERANHVLAENFVDALNPDEQAEMVLNLFRPELFLTQPPSNSAAGSVPVEREQYIPVYDASVSMFARQPGVQIIQDPLVRQIYPQLYSSNREAVPANAQEVRALKDLQEAVEGGATMIQARARMEVSPIIQVLPAALVVAVTKNREVPDRPLRCLIADDALMNRKILKRILASFTPELGFEIDVVEADNGDVALEILKENQMRGTPFDFGIFDKQMASDGRGLDGHLAAEQWRAIELGSHLTRMPIIAFTGSTTVEDIAECKRAGIDAFLRKGINGRIQLLNAILDLVHIEPIVRREAIPAAPAARSQSLPSGAGKS